MENEKIEKARRDFVTTCGKFALAAPPTLAVLLSTTGRGYASAGSLGNPGNHKPVGRAGESPNGRDFGSGDKGMSR